MSNHNIFKSPIANDHIPHSKRGFTLVEMLIIAPIVILVIGIFVSAIISMTGDVLSVRGKNALVYNIQDTLNRIDQDVKSSSGYLATNNIALTSPQGYDDNTSTFKNADASNGTMLILNTYATTANPLSSTRNFVYTTSPNTCNSALVSQNQKVAMNIVYFVKNNALWRRVIAPSNYATAGCSVPWQQPTCETSHVSGFCKAPDMKLVDGVSASGFVLNYYTSAAATTPIANAVNGTLSDTDRQTALQTASTIDIKISATKTLAGRDVTQSGTIRSISLNTGTTSNSLTLSNSGGGTWAYKRPITITNSSGGALTNYQVQISPFTDSNFVNNTGLYTSLHMNENSGTALTDSSGNNYSKSFSTGTPTWVSGRFGSAISFAGSQSVGLGTFDPNTQGAAFSVSTWINTSQAGSGAGTGPGLFFSKRTGTNTFSIAMNGGKIEVSNWSGTPSEWLVGGITVNNGVWHNVTLTWDGTTAKVYVDGNLDTQKAINFITQSIANGNSLGAFDSGTARSYIGSMDEVIAFNRALTASDISLRYGTLGVPKVRGDYADIRFANSTGATEYPYWQETDGKYWVKVPSLATGDTTINMYYGNPSATSSSNGPGTFIYFDDFETNTWTYSNNGAAYTGGWTNSDYLSPSHSYVISYPGTTASSIGYYGRLTKTFDVGSGSRKMRISVKDNYVGTTGYRFKQVYVGGTLYSDIDVGIGTAGWEDTGWLDISAKTGAQSVYFQIYDKQAVSNWSMVNYWDNFIITQSSSVEPTNAAPGAETAP